MFALVVTTPPAAEPLNLAEVKKHINLGHNEDDAYLQGLTRAVRMGLEQRYFRAIMQQSLQLRLDGFWQPQAERATWLPSSGTWMGAWSSAGSGSGLVNVWTVLELPPPVQSVTNIQYLDPLNVLQTLPTANYIVDTFTEPGRVFPALGKTWPVTAPVPGAVQINFVAGAVDAAHVNDDIKWACKLMIGHYYENREQVAVAIGHLAKAIDLPRGVDDLMGAYWRPRIL